MSSIATDKLNISEFGESAFHDYSMYVILDRAIPSIVDGLKPVQRRLVYAMSQLGLNETSKPKKSARTVGDVLGKFHPHGDSACYEAMVNLAQPFSTRYPLVDGHGNWGSPDDPKSFAAMRYTEARLAPMAQTLVSELKSGTVDFIANFDGTMKEPLTLPAQVPLLALNGCTGIAVGLATDIPPHNLGEIVDAAALVIESSAITGGTENLPIPQLQARCSLDDVMACVPAPDFPSGGRIISTPEDIREMYSTGRGSIKLQCKWQLEGNNKIVISELPYQASPSKVIEQIANLMIGKKLNAVDDIQDESDQNAPVRLVLTFRPRTMKAEAIMAFLCGKTDCQKSVRVNMNIIGLDGAPHQYSLIRYLEEWGSWRVATTRRRYNHRLVQINDRLHILQALLDVFVHIDEIIRIIRTEEDPKAALMARFHLDELQADAILNIRLRALAKLEYLKLQDEKAALDGEKAEIESILADDSRLRGIVIDEMRAIEKQLGDARRSEISANELADATSIEAMITREPVTLILSKGGFIRAMKGHDKAPKEVTFRPDDGLLSAVRCMTTDSIMVLDDGGRIYPFKAAEIPGGKGFGDPVSAHITVASGAKLLKFLDAGPEDEVFFAHDHGGGFFLPGKELYCKVKAGKPVFNLKPGVKMLTALINKGSAATHIACGSSDKRVLIFPASDVNRYPKSGGMALQKQVPGVSTLASVELIVQTDPTLPIKVFGKKLDPERFAYFTQGRGTKGRLFK